MSQLIAIDPGPAKSAYAEFDDGEFCCAGTESSLAVLGLLQQEDEPFDLAIEMIASYGMPVGAEVFETCVWIGRFIQVIPQPENHTKIYRKDVKLHLCGNLRAKDGNVRQAIIDRYGGKEAGIGTKKKPGPLYGVKGDEWSAIAVGLTYLDTRKAGKE